MHLFIRGGMLAGLAAVSLSAADPQLPLPVMSTPSNQLESGRFNLNFLPKAFQRNPELEMTAVCELTDYGRTLPVASPQAPVYYVGHSTGFQQRGDSVGGEHPPTDSYLGRVLAHSLAKAGFLPASRSHPPTLVLMFHWGSHNAMDRELAAMFPELANRQRLERAVLVGGRKFETSIARRLEFGDSIVDHAAKNDFLTDQASQSLYFVIVSAYDLPALARGQRQLVWRASLTANAIGVSMTDSLPALILTSAPFFGRDLAEPEILFRTVKRGVVEYGPLNVIEADVPVPRK